MRERKRLITDKITRIYWMLFLGVGFVFAGLLGGCNCEPAEVGVNSRIAAFPKALNFSSKEGETQKRQVKIKAMEGTVDINAITIAKGAPHYKIVKKPPLPNQLDKGQSFTIEISYTAPAGPAVQGLLKVESNASNPKDGILEIPLISVTNNPQLVFKPDPVNFGEIKKGATRTIEVVGMNTGRATLEIEQIIWNPKSSKAFTFPDGLPKAPIKLKAGEKFKFKVSYSPLAPGLEQGFMEFSCAGGSCSPEDPLPNRRKNPFVLKFQGVMATPRIAVNPTRLDFGFVPSGSSKTLKFTIQNIGSAPLLISQIAPQKGSSGAFVIPILSNVTIEPGRKKSVAVKFVPSTGSAQQGVVEIKSNDPNRPLATVFLVGRISAPDIEVTPKKLDFGKVPIKRQLAITIANAGNQPLKITAIELAPGSSPDFQLVKTNLKVPMTIRPNGIAVVPVVYTPKGKGKDIGKVIISSNDPDEPKVEVMLSGELSDSQGCDLVSKPTVLNFGLTVIGKPKELPLKLYNQGTKDCLISNLNVYTNKGGGFPPLGYNGPDVFMLVNPPSQCPGQKNRHTCNPPLKVTPGSTLLLKVAFLPLQEKKATPLSSPTYDGYLEIISNVTYRKRINLTGLATRSCVEVVPDKLDFGLVTVNCSSRKERITIYNTCSTHINVNKIGFSSAGPNGFRIVQAQMTPFTIPAGGSTDVFLAYRATPPPTQATAVLEIHHTIKQQSPISVPLVAKGTTSSEQTDKFQQAKNPMVDILFVVDDSCSMGDNQRNLANNFQQFIKLAKNLKVDFQIGVTTTTTDGGNPLGPQRTGGELLGNPPILTPQTPNLERRFQQYVRVGTGGSATEKGLEAARLALSPPLITTGKNKGFLRKLASLAIIIVSDEPDQSPQPVQYYINFFRNIKGVRNVDMLRVSVVIGYDEITKQNQCPSSNPKATSKGRYQAVAKATRGIIASICGNWGSTLSRLGALTFGLRRQFFLSRPADPTTIQVKVNGQTVPKGQNNWSYNSQDNSVDFKKPPAPGSHIEIKYKAVCY